MPVKQLRRIGAPIADSLSARIEARTLHDAYWPSQVDALEREHPDLIVRSGENIVAALPGEPVRLLYGFDSDREFCDSFPSMFAKLLPKIRRLAGRDGTIRFRLNHAPSRPRIEPVLKQLWFAPSRDWLGFSLARATKLPSAPAPRGIKFRDGGVADVPELLRIDALAFPDTPVHPDAMHARVAGGEGLLIAQAGGAVAGFCLYTMPETGQGFINILAVDPEHRRRGIGAALTTRAAKRLFADGARTVDLTTHDDNSPAIRLYVKLGFKQTRAGRDYTRPVDEKTIAHQREEQRGMLIRFGGWR